MKSFTKYISVLLLQIMIVTMIPVAAFAEDEAASAADFSAEEKVLLEQEAEQLADEAAEAATQQTPEEISEIINDEDAVAEETEQTPEENDADEGDYGYYEYSGEQIISDEEISSEVADPDELLENYLYQNVPGSSQQVKLLSVKGDRLTGNNLKYYNYYKTVIKNVAAAKQSSGIKTVSFGKFLGKRKFTAKELGVSRIGYKSGGKWHVDSKAEKKIKKLIETENWRKVYQALSCDLANDGYWVNWHSGKMNYTWSCRYNYNAKSLTFTTDSSMVYSVPVLPELAKDDGSSKYVYVADLNKIRAANNIRNEAKYFVSFFDENAAGYNYTNEQHDYVRLRFYANVIAMLTEYDHDSAALTSEQRYWRSPWSMLNVFDGDANTKTVCAGYARAYKYLCDMSKFKSRWIDCQIVTGNSGTGESAEHMWNIVRMNDGLNYLVDPTWMDDGETANYDSWFLRGAPSGTANSYTIYDINNSPNTRSYDAYTKSVFAAAERKLSTKDYYQLTADREISLKSTRISKLTKAKKAFTVKWSKVTKPVGALYVDGYQIQYSLKKNFKSAKKVTVKGYNSSSKTISKLKRKKTYYVRVRTYARLGGKTYYSSWSKSKKIKTK